MSRRAWIGAALFAVVCAFLITLVSCGSTPKPHQSDSMLNIFAGQSMGSGVYIGNGMVVTAAHVVAGVGAGAEVKLKTDDGKELTGEVAWLAPAYDIAFVRVKDIKDVASADLACRSPVTGENVMVEGNPIMLRFVRSWGRVSSDKIETIGDWKEGFIVDATIAPGVSGGPIYDEDGSVIGIVVGMPRLFGLGGFAYTIAVPSSTVCTLLGRKVS